MNTKLLKSVLISMLLVMPSLSVQAKQSTEANPWGYSGLINMPTANTLDFGEFYINGNYLLRNTGFSANAYMGIFDRLELGIVGGIPSTGFSGLAANLKYQLIKPNAKMPTSLAVGLSLLGLAADTKVTTGNSLYMVLSHDFNWQLPDKSNYNLFSGHIGFSGNLNGSRIMAGLDVPVTEYLNINAEYLGKVSVFDEMINFGIKAKPLPWLSVSLLTLGTSTKGFANTEYILSVGYNGKIPFFDAQAKSDAEPDKIVIKPSPEPTVLPTIIPTPVPSPIKTPEVVVSTPVPTAMPTTSPVVVANPTVTPPAIVSTPEPKPTALPTVVPTALPKPKITAEPEKEVKFGVLKGDIKATVGSVKPENVNVTLKALKGNFEQKLKSDAQGNYVFNNIPKGEYIVTFQREGFQEIKRQLFINPGDTTEANIEMTATNGSLSGRVLDNKGNALENITLTIDKGRKSLTQKNGKFNFSDITAGYHLLTVYSAGKEVKSFDIDIIAGTELTKEVIVDIAAAPPATKTPPVKPQVPVVKTEPVTKPVVKAPENPPAVKTPEKVVTKETPSKDGMAGITGAITDKKGALKSARVMFEGEKLTVMTISGADGNYTVKNIAIGTYKMTISKPGYITRVFSVKIKDAKQARHDVKLDLE